MKNIRKPDGRRGLYRRLLREGRGEGSRRPLGRKILPFLLIVALGAALALPVAALPTSTPKEEVVYVNLNRDGSVSAIHVVNIFELDADGQIVDYGNYTALRNLTTSDEIKVENETITIDTRAGRVYYEGTLSSNVLPWLFSIRYFLNGTEVSADEIGGKTGALEIRLSVRQNPDAVSSFFDHYALQISFSLDASRCKNIRAQDATLANNGKNKQISFTVMPGNEADYSITADATQFEMGGVSIAGVTMRMRVKLDSSMLADETQELKDGVAELDDGAQELKDGTADLVSGTGDLADGAGELRDGADQLVDGARELQDHTAEFVDGVSKLNDGAGGLKDGVADLKVGVGELADNTGKFEDGMKKTDDGLGELADALKKLKDGADQLYWGSDSLYGGASAVANGLSALTAQNAQLISASETMRAGVAAQYAATLSGFGVDASSFTYEDSSASTYYAAVLGAAMSARANLLGVSLATDAVEAAIPGIAAARIGTLSAELAAGDLSHLTELSELTQLSLIGLIGDAYGAYAAAVGAGGTGEAEGARLAAAVYYARQIAAAPDDIALLSAALGALSSASPCEALALAMQSALGAAYPAAVSDTLAAFSSDPAAITDLQTRAGLIVSAYALDVQAQASLDLDAVNAQVAAQLSADPEYVTLYTVKGMMDYYTGVIAYANGAASLASGAGNLAGGVMSLSAGAYSLYDGINKVYSGALELKKGTAELASGAAELTSGTIELRDGVTTLYDGVIELKDGTSALLDGSVELQDGILSFGDGVIEFRDGVAALYDGLITLRDGTITLHDGIVKLADGTFEFREKTADIDTRVADAIQEHIDKLLGSDFIPASFVSDLNTNVKSVQFVMQTEGISSPEAAEETEPDAAPAASSSLRGFWDRLVALFRKE